MTDADTNPAPEQPPQIRTICGFWRRVAAFLLDSLLLGIIGFILGLAFYADFARMGASGRWIGFAIALAYFALLNSAAGGGQTLGKRIMRIEVVDRAGRHIPLARSALRYVILGAPFFLNGALIEPAHRVLLAVAAVTVFWIGPSIIYLYVFNRRTRQSLHDLAVGSYVVDSPGGGAPAAGAVWRPHLAVVGCIALCAAALIPLSSLVYHLGMISDLVAVQAKVSGSGEFSGVGIMKGVNMVYKSGTSMTTRTLSVTASVRSRASLSEPVAGRAAAIVLNSYPGAGDEDLISVKLRYGYDIGISSSWISRSFEHSPLGWGRMLPPAP
ncbi:MAG TPA: RDD family protein [Opitutaceae bacterium]|jgi:uncharacterized RDD family membrane protein YckC